MSSILATFKSVQRQKNKSHRSIDNNVMKKSNKLSYCPKEMIKVHYLTCNKGAVKHLFTHRQRVEFQTFPHCGVGYAGAVISRKEVLQEI